MMANSISIIGGRLVDPGNGLDATVDIHVAGGRIEAIGAAPPGFAPSQTLDAEGLVVCPGLVDLGARMREPGNEHKATIESETAAAATAGITTLCTPPDTDPITDTPAVAELIQQRSRQTGLARVLPIGALTRGLCGEHLSEMAALKKAGCFAVSNALAPIRTAEVERRALEYASTFGLIVFLHPQDHSLAQHGCAHDGRTAARLGLPGIPQCAETVALARSLALVEQTGSRVHFCRLSTWNAVRMLARARDDGLPVTADVAVHHLHLTEDDIEGFNSNCHLIPPLRSAHDRDRLREAVAQGVVGALVSDHQPHEPEAKEAPFPSTAPGLSALETLLPLTLKLVDEGLLSLTDAVARLTSGPADIAGLPYGRLSIGATADICIFDPAARWRLQPQLMKSRGQNTPFLGRELQGMVTHTLLAGDWVHIDPNRQPRPSAPS